MNRGLISDLFRFPIGMFQIIRSIALPDLNHDEIQPEIRINWRSEISTHHLIPNTFAIAGSLFPPISPCWFGWITDKSRGASQYHSYQSG